MNVWWSPFLRKQSTTTPRKVRGNSGAKFGTSSGRRFEKFGGLLFCNFSDLRTSRTFCGIGGSANGASVSPFLCPLLHLNSTLGGRSSTLCVTGLAARGRCSQLSAGFSQLSAKLCMQIPATSSQSGNQCKRRRKRELALASYVVQFEG